MPALTIEASPLVEKSRAASRIGALDWTKGALVICMVVYHAINYSAFRPMAFEWMAFLPPSFILIAGFLVGQVYAAKYDLNSKKPYARLFIRGLKLLLIFVALNLAHCIALKRNIVDGLFEFGDRSDAIFLSGNGREGIFEVLLPIAYFLLLAPALLWLRSRYSAAIGFCAAGIFVLCVVLERNGYSYKNLSFLSAGILGMAAGLIPISLINRFAMKWFLVVPLYGLYRWCSYYFGETYPVQLFGAVSTLLLLYTCALRLNCTSGFGAQMVLLGKYTLAGYLIQIPLIQVIVVLSGGKPDRWLGVWLVILVASVLTFGAVWVLDVLRKRSTILDGTYKAVFA